MELLKEVNSNNYNWTYAPTENSEYGLVLEYADSTLTSYLNNHFDKLTWDDKFELALQLASAVSYLHKEDIVHCNLVMLYL